MKTISNNLCCLSIEEPHETTSTAATIQTLHASIESAANLGHSPETTHRKSQPRQLLIIFWSVALDPISISIGNGVPNSPSLEFSRSPSQHPLTRPQFLTSTNKILKTNATQSSAPGTTLSAAPRMPIISPPHSLPSHPRCTCPPIPASLAPSPRGTILRKG